MLTETAAIAVSFLFGSIIGFLVQRSRFCNASAIRDAMLFKSFRNAKPMLVGMMVLTFFFTLWETFGVGNPTILSGGMYTVFGLFIFGIGMILAGSCTMTTLTRTGEGNMGAFWCMIFIFIGILTFSFIWNYMRWPAAFTLMTDSPKMDILHFGFVNAETLQSKLKIPAIVFGLVQIGILAMIYRAILKRENR